MRTLHSATVAVVTAWFVACPAARADTLPTVAVLDTRLPASYGAEGARTAEELVASALQQSGLFRAINRSDLGALLGLEQQRQLLGTEGGQSASQLAARALGSDLLAVLDVGTLGPATIATLKVLDVRRSGIVARVQAPLEGPSALPVVIAQLAQGVAAEWRRYAQSVNVDPKAASVAKAYEEALQAERDGLWAQPRFERLVELDPAFAPALLWLALAVRQGHAAEAREYHLRAMKHRVRLTPDDQALLDAVGPFFAEPFDPHALERKLSAAVEARPTSARLWLQLGRAHHLQKRYGDALLAYRKAAELDPTASEPVWLEGLVLAHMGEREAARATIERCLHAAPFATSCLGEHAKLAEAAGRWNEVEADARRLVAMDAADTSGLRALARARAGLHQPVELVRSAFERAWAAQPREENARFWNEAWLHEYAGRYDLAEKLLLDGLEPRLASGDVHRIVSVAATLFEIYQETGQKKPAQRLADRIAPYVESGSENTLGGWSRDGARLLLAAVRAWAGALSRKEYMDAWRAAMARVPRSPVPLRASTVLYLSTRTPQPREEALEILAFLPPSDEKLGRWPSSPAAERDMGLLLARAERFEDAIPHLEAGTRAWVPLGDEMRLDASLMLARAYEATCDLPAAKAAYEELVTRFGSMKPPSVSVAEAKKGLARLRVACRK